MKKLILSIFTIFMIASITNGQNPVKLWYAKGSGNAQVESVHKAVEAMYSAFISGNEKEGWNGYTDDATEIDPTGNVTFGKKALLDNWEAFMKMVDEKPKFTYSDVKVRMVSNDVAIAIYNTTADIKIKGQQIGGNTKGMAVLHKIKGAWKVVFDQLTPVMPMPEH